MIIAFKGSIISLIYLPLPSTSHTITPYDYCSENKASDQLIISIPCSFLSSNYNLVYATPSYVYLTDVNLTYCQKIFNATLPEFIPDGEYEFSMNWSNLICGNCEAQGNKCQRKMKSNSTEPEIECIQKPAKGTN